jgi:hypothetical protein
MVKKLQPTSQPITQKSTTKTETRIKNKTFHHNPSPKKTLTKTKTHQKQSISSIITLQQSSQIQHKRKSLEKRSSLGVRQQTHHNYLPTKTTYLLPKTTYLPYRPTYLPTYQPKSKMAGVELVGDKLLLLFYYLRIFFTFTSQEFTHFGRFWGTLGGVPLPS